MSGSILHEPRAEPVPIYREPARTTLRSVVGQTATIRPGMASCSSGIVSARRGFGEVVAARTRLNQLADDLSDHRGNGQACAEMAGRGKEVFKVRHETHEGPAVRCARPEPSPGTTQRRFAHARHMFQGQPRQPGQPGCRVARARSPGGKPLCSASRWRPIDLSRQSQRLRSLHGDGPGPGAFA